MTYQKLIEAQIQFIQLELNKDPCSKKKRLLNKEKNNLISQLAGEKLQMILL